MVTKEGKFCLKSYKQQSFINANNHNDPYSNLNLNRNFTSTSISSVQSDSKASTLKKGKDTDNNEGKKGFPTCMKSVSSYEITEKEVQEMFERKKENRQQYFSKKDNLSNVNTSTLSLHIAAYENSAEASAHANEFNEEKEDSKMSNGKSILAEKWKKAKQIIAGPLPVVQNPFEFPRQQRNQIREPEVMQFKASQRLLNPNESRAEDQQKRIWGSMDIYDEQLGEQASIEKDIQQLTLAEISSQRTGLSSRIGHLSNEISDLAFNNYRTYADAGRTAEHCKKMFSNIHSNVTSIKENMPELTSGIKTFAEKTKEFHKEYDNVATVNNRENLLWKILDMPKIMHQCIRSGEYEAAFALTDFAVSLKHSRLYQQPIIKKPVDFVIEARHGLLDELFNKFSGPIDLSRSIQVVNNIRKIPYISNTQLRVSILQYRDVFLDSQVTKSMSKEDYIYKIVDIYRDCMYDTMVLYLAVFPDTESHRRFVTTHDPRWERWTGSSQNYHLQAWAHKNLEHLFEYIRNCTASKINYEALREKLMSFASSFGRMGLDFRLLILEELRSVETKIFKEKVGIALHNLITKKVIHLVDSEIVEMARSGLIQNNAMEAASLPLDMIAWDDLVAYANEIITCLNDLRHSLGVNQINDLFETLVNSFTQLLSWIDGFLESEEDSVLAKRASRIVIEHFIPFMQTHFKSNFSLPLQEKWRLRDENDSVTPFDFKLDCAAYEPTPQKEHKIDNGIVNGEASHTEIEAVKEYNGQNSSTEINTESSHFGAFASTFASQMQALWHDDVNPESDTPSKDDQKKNLNERFEKVFSARSSQEPQSTPQKEYQPPEESHNELHNLNGFTDDGIKTTDEMSTEQNYEAQAEEHFNNQQEDRGQMMASQNEHFNENSESLMTSDNLPPVAPSTNSEIPFSTIALDDNTDINETTKTEN